MKRLFGSLLMLYCTSHVNAQVNLQTGSAEQSFPLINYTDSKAGLSLGVSVAYSSGNGLLVNDVASDIGTGWNLDAGGMITRIQQGEPDDQPENNNGPSFARINDGDVAVNSVLRRYPNGFMYNPNVGKGCHAGLNVTPLFKKDNSVYKDFNIATADVEQDKFVFRVNGRSGVFVIPHNWQPNKQCTILGDAKMKITFTVTDMKNLGIRTTIDKFIITTEDGIKYTFKDRALTWICRYKDSYRDATGNWLPFQGAHNNDGRYAVNYYWGTPLPWQETPLVVNSWYLSEIENPNTGQKITYNYESAKTNLISSKFISHQRKLNESTGWLCSCEDAELGQAWFNWLYSNGTGAVANEYSWDYSKLNRLAPGATTVFYNRAYGFSARIKQINLPNGGAIKFKYSSVERLDLKGENALEEISYTLNSKVVRQYRLTQGYFYWNSIFDYYSHPPISEAARPATRLCLLSIQKIGNGEDNASEPPYYFNYYTGSKGALDDIVPPRNFLNQDHWGYYNGDNANISIYEDHDNLTSGFGYFKATLPMYKNPKEGYAKNGLLKEVTYPTGGKLVYYYDQIAASQSVLPAPYSNITSAGGVAVSLTVLKDPEFPSRNITKSYQYIKPGTNISSYWGVESPSYYGFSIFENNLKCGYGIKHGGRAKYKNPGLLYPEMATSVEAGKSLGAILLSTAISVAVSVLVEAIFSGTIVIPILNIIEAVIIIIKFWDVIKACNKTLHYYYYNLTNVNNAMSNPLPSYFSSVQVQSNSPGGYNGKTVYEFTSPADYPLLVPQLKWPYVQNQRTAIWTYGNPKKITVYDKENQIVSQTQNNYHNILSLIPSKFQELNGTNTPTNYNCKCATINKQAIRSDDWQIMRRSLFSTGPVRWMNPIEYNYFSGRTDLLSTIQNSYSNNQLYNRDFTAYISDPATLLQKGKITYRDASSIVVDINYYPTDYNIPGSAVQQLIDNNAIHVPVSTEKWLLGWQTVMLNGTPIPQYTWALLSSNVTEFQKYTIAGHTEIKPYRTYVLKTDRPIPYQTIGFINPSQLLRHPEYYKLESEMVYDNGGNLVETHHNSNITSFVNDYADRYVTASIAGASYTDVAYSSFETVGKGNWEFDLNAINTTTGLTGSQSYTINASNHVFKSGLNTAQNYTVTYWVKDDNTPSITVNGQSGTLLYQANGWKLYKHSITGSTSVTVAGSGIIDEIRLYPGNALMSTATYKEGIGKVSDCDANNRVLFYEYDALGRLKLMRDQNRNVIKTYEYNYKQ